MSYDPVARGALCGSCPLAGQIPVPPEIRPGYPVVIGDSPSEEDADEGHPFVGRAGIELARGLGSVGRNRLGVSLTNAILCPLPEFKTVRMEAALRVENRRRAAAGLPLLLHPVACCRPRLVRDLEDAAGGSSTVDVITLGSTALKALGIESGVLDIRGGPRQVPVGTLSARVLPTIHPAFVLHARRWTRAFRADLGRAFRWFSTGLNWRDPEILYRPTAAQLSAWLEREAGSLIIYDVETLPGFPAWDHYDPMHDRIRYLGLASEDGRRAVGIPLLAVADNRPVYTRIEGEALVEVLRAFFVSPRWRKGGQNSGYYDRLVIEHFFGVTPAPHIDLIGLHKMAEPELPHRLGYIGSIHTDAPSWKDEFDAKAIRDDADMRIYNARDCAITAQSFPPVAAAVRQRGQERAARFWPVVQDFCVQLHRNGLPVDQAVRAAWDLRLRTDARHYLKTIRESLGRSTFNPNSVVQLRDLLFEEWGLLPYGKPTDSGDPSTGDDTLRAMLGPGYGLSPAQRVALRAVRRYRATTKLRGTYVVKMRPIGQPVTDADLAFDADESSDEREARIEKLGKRPGLVMADGRVHSDYNAHGTVGWRLSSSRPNMQNAPTDIRDMFVAPPGRIFIGCDEAQLELRMVAGIARAEAYCEALRNDADPHYDLCIEFFGDTFLKAGKGQKKTLRRFVKEFTYACTPKDTLVATLGPEGAKPIGDIRVGDWTWSWDGGQYAPARIIAKTCHGVRPCVRVSFKRQTTEGVKTESVIFTDDHRFLLRDGTYQEAGMLQPGDSLMPFARWTDASGYRVIDPRNDGGRSMEHRVVCGLPSSDPRVVHHADRIRNNNAPQNLSILESHGTHSRLHWEDPDRRERQRASRAAGCYYRRTRGIPYAAKNPTVVSVERVDPQEVWDIEVDHPAHNFALAAGIFIHNSTYMAADETKHTVLTSSEGWVCGTCGAGLDRYLDRCPDHPGARHEKRILYPDLTLRDVSIFSRKWLDHNPEIEAWWEAEIAGFRKNGFVAEPVFGMRRDFLDGEEPNEIVNLRPQSGGSALVHLATQRAIPEIRRADPSALFVLQGHDSLVFEAARDHEKWTPRDGEPPAEFGYCPPGCQCRANKIARILEAAMKENGDQYGMPVPFQGEAAIGYTLQEV